MKTAEPITMAAGRIIGNSAPRKLLFTETITAAPLAVAKD
jgi:hypothetical protein